MLRLVALAAVVACSGTQSGTTGKSDSLWELPLIGPLEEGPLLTAVTINTYGPYVFVIDLDSPISAIDTEAARLAKLVAAPGPLRLDEAGTPQQRPYTALQALEIGSLIIDQRDAIIVRANSFDSAGRRIHGLLGRDVLGNASVFGIDRDRGVVVLVEAASFKRPAGAAIVPYVPLPAGPTPEGQLAPAPRNIVKATVNGAPVTLHVDLGATASQLREPKWAETQLVSRPVQLALIDELGTRRVVAQASEPAAVVTGALTAPHVAFVPYDDRRWPSLDGTLGLGAFAAVTVWQDLAANALVLVPRREIAPAHRIARWDDAVLQKCKSPGCAAVKLIDPLNGAPPVDGKPHPGLVLSITRDEVAGGMPLEVTVSAQGKPELPRLVINLPAHTDRLVHHLKPEFLGATLVVVDASPFPRSCPGGNGCVDQISLAR